MKVVEVTLEEALRQARMHQGDGNLIVAERVYRDILETDAEQPDALREIGIVSYLRGKPREGYAWFKKARAAEPDNPIVLSNFAVMAAETGHADEAVSAWREAIGLAPDYVDAYSNLARVLVQQGETAEAIRLCRTGVARRPEHVDVRVNLGFALEAHGDFPGALEVWEGVLAAAPEHPVVCANLAKAYRDVGRTKDAVALGERAVAADPRNAHAHVNLGNAYFDQGDPNAAEQAYLRATECDPRHADAYDNLGAVLHQQGRSEEAARWHRFALAIDDTRAKSYAYLSGALRAVGAFADAESAAQQSLLLAPENVEYQIGLADLLLAVDRADEAEAVLNDTLQADPESVSTRLKLARALERLDRFDEAEALACEAGEQMPESPWPPLTLAQIRLMSGNPAGAAKAGQAALDLAPDFVPAHIWFAEYHVTMGNLGAADTWARQALKLQPSAVTAYGAIANTKRFTRDDPDLAAMENAYAERENEHFVSGLSYALAKALDDAGEHKRAFDCYARANAYRRRGFHYSKPAAEDRLEALRHTWTAESIAALAEHGDSSAKPIFIVGMPRSGTTLIEQVLSSHPAVYGAGELTALGRMLRRYGPPGPETIRMIGRGYVDLVDGLAPDAARVSDKMPGNYQNLGVIAAALPNATIIHARRDALDTCLSCFQQSFAHGQHWSYDLEELGHQYRVYEATMSHWRSVLPNRFLEVDYEAVVNAFETQVRRLVAAAGLEWDSRCLEFHRTERVVLTASKGQVRQPIYRHSIGKRARYGDRIEPLLDALERYAGLVAPNGGRPASPYRV